MEDFNPFETPKNDDEKFDVNKPSNERFDQPEFQPADDFAPKQDNVMNKGEKPLEFSGEYVSDPIPVEAEVYSFDKNMPPFTVDGDSRSSYTQYAQTKPKKEKKPMSTGKVVVVAICSAICASLITCMVFMFGSSIGLNAILGKNSGSTTNIVVDSQAENAVQAVAEKVSPSVCGVVVTTSVNSFFFGNTESQSQGSGIIYSQDGYIITNYHVIASAVEDGGKLAVYLPADLETGVDATVVGFDVSADIAVIKIEKTGLPAIEIGDSSKIKAGQTAIAIGNPGGLDFYGSISAGIISGLERTIQTESSMTVKLIQTDAAINPGNSGGALVNINGQLIGINSAKLASTGYEGMGFAIPSNDAVTICERIINKQGQAKPYLGIELSTYYTSQILQQMGYPAGVVVTEVAENSPADEVGIKRGDVITELNGVAVSSVTQYNSEKDKYSPGETISITIFRQNKNYTTQITLGTANS